MADFTSIPDALDLAEFAWVTSDLHMSHARIIELANRPFSSVGQMDGELIRRWNRVVKPTDKVLVLGDLALGGIEISLPKTAALNGDRYLVPGNHDQMTSAQHSSVARKERMTALYEQYGWHILPEIVEATLDGRRLLLSHYPFRGDSLSDVERYMRLRPVDDGVTPLIHGHLHLHDRGAKGREFHVGVDAFEYAPVPMGVIREWLAGLA